jgi:hypothetical protein
MDEANRFLQAHSLAQNPTSLPPSVPYPGLERISDPSLAKVLKPLPAHFGYMRNRALYSQYNPLLALMAAPFYAAFGQRGIYVPTIVGGLFLAWLLALGMNRGWIGFHKRLLLVLLSTAIPFYCLTFFSHTIALSLAVGSALLIRKQQLVAAAVLASVALVLREEMILCYPLLLLMFEHRPKTSHLVAAGLVMVVVFVGLQRMLTGHWLGTHVSASGWQRDVYGVRYTWLGARLYIARMAFVNAYPGSGAAGMVLGLLLWAAWAIAQGTGGLHRRLAIYLGLLICAVPLVAILLRGLVSLDVMQVQNPLVVFPLLWVVKPPRRALVLGGCIVLLMVLLMSPMHAEDFSWGFRHALMLAAVMCLFPRPGASPGVIRAALAVGILATVVSLTVLTAKRVRFEGLIDQIQDSGGSAIATSWEQPQDLASLMVDGFPVLYAPTTENLLHALRLFEDADPVVLVRRESPDLLLYTARHAGMSCELIGSGFEKDPLTNVLLFGCRPAEAVPHRQ